MSERVGVCSECSQPLTRQYHPEDEDGSAYTDFVCPEHGVRATVWGSREDGERVA